MSPDKINEGFNEMMESYSTGKTSRSVDAFMSLLSDFKMIIHARSEQEKDKKFSEFLKLDSQSRTPAQFVYEVKSQLADDLSSTLDKPFTDSDVEITTPQFAGHHGNYLMLSLVYYHGMPTETKKIISVPVTGRVEKFTPRPTYTATAPGVVRQHGRTVSSYGSTVAPTPSPFSQKRPTVVQAPPPQSPTPFRTYPSSKSPTPFRTYQPTVPSTAAPTPSYPTTPSYPSSPRTFPSPTRSPMTPPSPVRSPRTPQSY